MDSTFLQRADDIEDRGLPGPHDPTLVIDARQLWWDAPDWYHLTELNRRYLEGKLPLCPSYDEHVWSETARFSNLLELHDYGIISTNSSPGSLGHPELRQRPFLFFNIPTHGPTTTSPDALRNFVQKLQASTEVYAHIRFQYFNAPHGIQRDRGISSLMLHGSYHNLPINSPLWESEGWTITPDGPGQSDNLNFVQSVYLDDPSDYARMPIQTNGSLYRDDLNPIRVSHMADPLQISVLAPDSNWDYTGIGQLIKRLLDESGILPAYPRRE